MEVVSKLLPCDSMKKPENRLIDFTDKNFQTEALKCELPVLVVFGTDWTGLCHIMDPILEKFAAVNKGKIRVGKLDVDGNSMVASLYVINKYPTLILLKDGAAIWRHAGLISFKDLTAQIKPILQVE
jgi:thioredoxin 1